MRICSFLAVTAASIALGAGDTSAHDLETVIDGRANDRFGRDLCGLGDMNGDGVPDFVVGMFGHIEGGWGPGGARVISGADWSVIHEVFAPVGSWAFGRNVGGGFDANGDGRSEFIVSDAIPDYVAGPTSRVIVYSGLDGSVLYDIVPTGFAGTSQRHNFGGCVGGAGDLDDDGVDDFYISASYAAQDVAGTVYGDGGAVIGYSGATGLELGRIGGTYAWAHLGQAVAPIGDYDGDGHDDLAVTALQPDEGWVYLVSGADFSILASFGGFADSHSFGWSVESLGDVTGDGVIDLAVGDTTYEVGIHNRGRVSVLSGADGSLLYHLMGSQVDEDLGWEITRLGDYDGDTYSDFALGSREQSLMLDDGSAVFIHSGATGALLGALYGREADDEFGYSIANLGDLDADGTTDFAVGAYAFGGPPGSPGRVYVYTGLCDETLQYCDALPNSSGMAAEVAVIGSRSLAANDTSLRVTQGPAGKFGIFFYGFTRDNQPFGAGRLCVGVGSGGLYRLKPPHLTDAAGVLERDLDFTQLPLSSGTGAILPGSTANFQFWFRDTGGFNLSRAVSATFCW